MKLQGSIEKFAIPRILSNILFQHFKILRNSGI